MQFANTPSVWALEGNLGSKVIPCSTGLILNIMGIPLSAVVVHSSLANI